MFLILILVALGILGLICGVVIWSDPNSNSASISIRWRNVDVNFFPADASVAGPIPGWVLSLAIVGVGLMSLTGAYFSFVELRKRKNAK
jgi:amino acid transporter